MDFGNNYLNKHEWVRKVAIWAGVLGLAQSMIWIGLTITSIFAYNCFIDLPPAVNFGTIEKYVFFYLYFKGKCQPDVYQPFNSTLLETVDRILDPRQILIWSSVYLAVSVCWLVASILLMIYKRKDDVKLTVIVLGTWATLTFFICALDLAQGIIFGLDYGYFHQKAYKLNLDPGRPGAIDPNGVILIAAQIAALSMVLISLKGFVLWVINAAGLVYVFSRVISLMRDDNGKDILFIPYHEPVDIPTHPAISTFETKKLDLSYNNGGFVPDNRSGTGIIELNQEAIKRAARMSIDPSLQENRFRNFDSFQQYPPPRMNNSRRLSKNSEGFAVIGGAVDTALLPEPDYSPTMSRGNQHAHNISLGSQRF